MNNTPLKYELTDIGHPHVLGLHRIRALRDIPVVGVKAGDLGGWVESEKNLSQHGDSWVGDGALVFNEARVHGNAQAYGKARAFGNAQIYGESQIYGNAWAYENARIYGNASVYDDVHAFGNAQIYGRAQMYGNALAYGKARAFGESQIYGESQMYGNAQAYDDARLYGNAQAYDNVLVGGQARVREAGDILYARIIAFGIFSATLYRTAKGHDLHVGCWEGTIPEFRTMIESDEWVEATPEQIELRRPELLAFADMCEARVGTWDDESATPTRTGADNTGSRGYNRPYTQSM